MHIKRRNHIIKSLHYLHLSFSLLQYQIVTFFSIFLSLSSKMSWEIFNKISHQILLYISSSWRTKTYVCNDLNLISAITVKHKSCFEQILIMKSMDCFIVPSLLLWDYMHKKEKNHFGTFSIPLEVIGIQMKDSFGVYYKSYRRANSRHSAINLFF